MQDKGISLQSKFLFGIRSDIRSNVHFLDDNRILYPVGHNICILSIDSNTQLLIPGIEGTEGITAITVSKERKFFAVAEKSERAICTVYALDNKNNKAQKRKTLTSTDVQSKEFVSIAFSQ